MKIKAHFFVIITIMVTTCFAISHSLAQADHRIISADANATAVLLSLGLAAELVAVDSASVLPNQYEGLSRLGYHRALSTEGLLSLQPTLVIGSDNMGPPPVITQIRQAGVELLQLPTPYDLVQLRLNIETVAKRFDRAEMGEQLIGKVDLLAAGLGQQVAGASEIKPRVLFLLTREQQQPRAAGARTAGSALINLLGGENVVQWHSYQSVTTEAIAALNPEIILVAGHDMAAAETFMAAHPLVRMTEAGQRQQVLAVDGSALVAGMSVATLSEADRLNRALSAKLTGYVPVQLRQRY